MRNKILTVIEGLWYQVNRWFYLLLRLFHGKMITLSTFSANDKWKVAKIIQYIFRRNVLYLATFNCDRKCTKRIIAYNILGICTNESAEIRVT